MGVSAILYAAMGLAGIALALMVASIVAKIGFPVPDENRRLGSIDGLRGYLALLVMIDHGSIWMMRAHTPGPWRSSDVFAFRMFGEGSVLLFFMITGCLFFPKALRGVSGNNWRAIYMSRVFRILPLQVVVVVIASVLSLVRVESVAARHWLTFPIQVARWMSSSDQPALFGYAESGTINALVLWSLWWELKYYLIVLPIFSLIFTIFNSSLARWAVPILMVCVGIASSFSITLQPYLFYYAAFGFGMIGLNLKEGRAGTFFANGGIGALSVAIAVGLLIWGETWGEAAALLVLAFVFLCVICGNRFGGSLSFPGALVLGETSFSIYMLHGIVLNIAFVSFEPWIEPMQPIERAVLVMLLLPSMALLSVATFLLIERPAIRIGREVSARKFRTIAEASGKAVAH